MDEMMEEQESLSVNGEASQLSEVTITDNEHDHIVGAVPGSEGAGQPAPIGSLSLSDNPSTSKSQSQFHIQTNLIPKASVDEQNSELKGLGLEVYNQDELEQGIMAQVDQAMAKDEEERIKKLMEKQLTSVEEDLRATREELERIGRVIRTVTSSKQAETNKEARKHLEAAKRQRENKLNQMKKLKAKKRALLSKLDGQEMDASLMDNDEDLQFFDQALAKGCNSETEEQRMIKLGEMTPFGTVMKTADVKKQSSAAEKIAVAPKPSVVSDFEMFLQNKDDKYSSKKGKALKHKPLGCSKSSHTKLHHSGAKVINGQSIAGGSKPTKSNWFDEHDKKVYRTEKDFSSTGIKRKLPKLKHNFSDDPELSDPPCDDEDEWDDQEDGSEEEYRPHRDWREEDSDYEGQPSPKKKRKAGLKRQKSLGKSCSDGDNGLGTTKGKSMLEKDNYLSRTRDDGNYNYYQKRLKMYKKTEAARKKQQREEGLSDSDDEETEFEGGLKVPGKLWSKLFGYQKTGVKWLWELHCQQAGGIVGDEMGLGKTIQTISFLASLKTSKIKQRPFRYVGLGPCIIVCPATVLHQWVREFHKWWPEFRVAILHSSGSFTGTEDALIHNIVNQHGILITSYTSLVHKQDALIQHDWHYIILDEGHKIRNPDAQVTLACKQFRTPHRIILSGSPIQNNLKELWSLFDFVFPGKLGTLPDFMTHFSVPIVQGGYANASQVQVQTAYKCACILRDTISPYLLRRMKADVKSSVQLPGKSEQVLFCRLTDEQREVYQEYLDSKECNAILAGRYKVFAGLITLRKICNHPDISTGGPRVLVGQSTEGDESLEYGYWRRSGKLIVVESLLKLWHKQGQKVLLFTQSKQMLDILESFVKDVGYSYLKMDGGTSISARQPLINKYNSNPDIFVFLLTTRVGGLGVNLTGANRVVIFDPDWNPSTDMQARERAWRIGQSRQVTIYRLLTTGTIEEKIYHRQIFKQFLTNRVLKDPKQRRFFKTNDLYELFTLGTNDNKEGTETSAIFAGTGSEVTVSQRVNRFDAMKNEALPVKRKEAKNKITDADTESSSDKTDKLRALARKLSLKIGQGNLGSPSSSNGVTEASSELMSSTDNSSQRKKKKKKSKRKKDAEFEGERISHLSKLSEYRPNKKAEDTTENLSSHQDDYVLKKLFKKTGIQGAIKHDVIEEASKMDYVLVEGEAEKVAREAAAALKKSRRQCMNALSGVPNWTGQQGGGMSNSRPRFGRKKNSLIAESSPKASSSEIQNGDKNKSEASKAFDGTFAGNKKSTGLFSSSKQNVMSSGELLSRMKARNVSSCQDDGEEDGTGPPSGAVGDKHMELITDIRNFIAFQCHIDGQASTQELLDEFGVKLPPGDSAKFKAMLRQICDFDRSSDVGIWRLKAAYR